MTNQGRDFRSPPCEFCGGVHLGTQPGRCVYQCQNCGEDTRPSKPVDDGETWQHKCDTPRSQGEIEEKKFEQLLNEPPHLLARPDPSDVCMCGDRRIEHGEPPNDGPCRLNGLGHSGAPPCNGFRLARDDQFTTWMRAGEGRCYACQNIGNLFRRKIDGPQLLHCADCRDEINRANLTPSREDDLHDTEGRPISLIEEMADESKLSALVAETTKEFTSLRCCDCRCGHATKDHIVTGETEFCRPCLIAAGHPYEPRREL